MGAFTVAMFFIPIERVNALSDISNLFYISGAAYRRCLYGTTAWIIGRWKVKPAFVLLCYLAMNHKGCFILQKC